MNKDNICDDTNKDLFKFLNSYKNYEDYVNKQLDKTNDVNRQKLWLGPEWQKKIDIFKKLFNNNINLIKYKKKAICLGSRTVREVVALKELGIEDSIGIDLHSFEPYTIKGDLRDNYINFITGNSKVILKNLKIDRIHFAFLDGAHHYKHLIQELEFVEKRQLKNDIIICDDYTLEQFPEICQAVDYFLSKKKYNHKIYYGDDGTKKRGYVYMIKK